ncbi:TetR/AcrR family transcriptional regulator [Paenibacillus radicis (ex Gao et al. 2016)]|uniref:TetR family transcriptional regulator n=1 Tax=Paenibacillus radicis (ex Gao et al. 2016) TaxID=1737354 RepID=A0A917GPU0_9BACL|nr:TetR/AcrR family transcriptional regulator [Paenibacillus radicis (ex Gao et al. 2016)]GGG53075.1 TetR family transcriptional regulator [Paenibacillus radicis (ex Gao et al. 2016)]
MNGTRRQKHQLQSINLMKQALIDLIIENGTSDKITVSEISDRADLNRGTYYTHFKDKSELLEALFHDAVEGIKQALTSPYKNVNRVELSAVVPSTILLCKHIELHKRLFKALDMVHNSPNVYDRLEQMHWELFTKEIQVEHANAALNTDYEILISYQSHAIAGVFKYWIRSDFKYSAEYMCDQITTLVSKPLTAMIMKNNP